MTETHSRPDKISEIPPLFPPLPQPTLFDLDHHWSNSNPGYSSPRITKQESQTNFTLKGSVRESKRGNPAPDRLQVTAHQHLTCSNS